MLETKLSEYIDVKEELNLKRFETSVSIGTNGAYLAFFGLDSEELHNIFIDYLQEKYLCEKFDFKTEKPFDELLENDSNENYIFDLYDIPDEFDIDTIIRNFRFNRDFIAEKKLRIFILASHFTLDLFNEIAYDFVSFNNFYGIFHDQSVDVEYKVDDSKLKESIQKYKDLGKNVKNEVQLKYLNKIIEESLEISAYSEAFKYVRLAEKKAIKINSLYFLQWLLRVKGDLYYYLHDINIAIKYFNDALVISNKINVSSELAKTFISLGRAYSEIDNFTKSFSYYRKALDINKRLNNLNDEAFIYKSMANIYSKKREYNTALEFYKKSESIYNRTSVGSYITNVYNNMGKIYLELGNQEKGIYFINKALSVAREESNKYEILFILRDKGIYYINKGDFYKALYYLKESLVLSKKMNINREIAFGYSNISITYLSLGNFENFIEYNQLAMNSFKKNSDKDGISNSYSSLAAFENEQGNCNEAIKYIDKVKKILPKELGKEEKKIFFTELGDAYNCLNEYRKAEFIFIELLEIVIELQELSPILYTKNNLSYTYIKLQKKKEAKELLDEVLEATQNYEDQYLIASVYINYAFYYKLTDEQTNYTNSYNKAKKIIEHGHYKLLENKLLRI